MLIFDGEELIGAKQNRIVNTTLLIGVGESVLPVSCVEHGRWSHRAGAFSSGDWASHPELRKQKQVHVRESLELVDARPRGSRSRDSGGRTQRPRGHGRRCRRT